MLYSQSNYNDKSKFVDGILNFSTHHYYELGDIAYFNNVEKNIHVVGANVASNRMKLHEQRGVVFSITHL